MDDKRRTPSDGNSSHCLWQGELKRTDNAVAKMKKQKNKTKEKNKCGGVKPANGIPTLPLVIPHKTTYTYSYIQENNQSPNTGRRDT